MTLLLSVAIAFGLWLYVITVEQPESQKTYYDIPVVLQNESILAERLVAANMRVGKSAILLEQDGNRH